MTFPPWANATTGVAILVILTISAYLAPHPDWDETINVAFVGNSMIYYNDCPRFMEALSDHHIRQNSCLRGTVSITGILEKGNGMYNKWRRKRALIAEGIYDFGACTVKQLLFGYDEEVAALQVDGAEEENEEQDDDNNNNDDDDFDYDEDEDKNEDDDYNFNDEGSDNGGYFGGGIVANDDGKNACLQSEAYLQYITDYYANFPPPSWDFVVINDFSSNLAFEKTVQRGKIVLEWSYIPWIKELGAIPVILNTHAYPSDQDGLQDIPTFTSLVYDGAKQYAALFEYYLPPQQKPRIALQGVAFLMVWEENRDMWYKLFHSDQKHPSPHGSFLQGCMIHHALFGRMPLISVALQNDMSVLWEKARRMQPSSDEANPIPTREEAQYLYDVAKRVAVHGERPKSLAEYSN